MAKFHPFGGQIYTLGSSISSTATTILLSSFLEPVTNVPYTMVLLNTDIAYATIAPKTNSSEFVSFTGITQNVNGTALLTGVVRGLAKKYPFASDSAYKLPHSGQTQFIISDAPQVFEEYDVIENDVTITGKKTFPGGGNANAPVSGTVYSIPTDDLEYASKKYVDNIAIAGSPLATDSVFGISKLSVAAASPTVPIVVGTNDTRVPTQGENDALVGTSGTPSSTNKYVTNDDTATAATADKVARRLASGNITITTETQGDNSTKAASTAYVDTGLTARTGSKIYLNAATVTISPGTNVETTLFSTTILANTLSTANALRIRMNLLQLQTNNATQDVTIRCKYGTTIINTIPLSSQNFGVIPFIGSGFIEFYIYANAATNAQYSSGQIMASAGGTPPLWTNILGASATGTATEDSTANKTLTITVQASNQLSNTTIYGASIEVIKS